MNNNLHKSLRHQTLLAEISQLLLSLENFNDKLQHATDLLGESTNVSRVYIFENSQDNFTASNTFEWCNTGVSPQKDELQDLPYELIPSWRHLLNRDGFINSSNISELPEDIRGILEPQNIQSILVFPLTVSNQLFGFVGFDQCEIKKVWDADEIHVLKTISGILSGFYERKKLFNNLKESEARWHFSVDGSDLGLWDWDIVKGRVFFSKKWKEMLGYGEEEITENIADWETRVHPEDLDSVNNDINEHFIGNTPFYINEHRVKCKDGTYKWIHDRGQIVATDSNGKPIRMIGTHMDITERKKNEIELKNLNATKDKLFSIIAHDLKGPIGTIMQISEIISDFDNISLENDTLLEILRSQKELTKSTYELVENLLNWAKFNLNAVAYKPHTLNLNDALENNLSHLKFQAKNKNIRLNSQIPHNMRVYTDINMLNAIFRNLISNSIKFTPENGIVEILAYKSHEHVIVDIKDSGVGISKENIEKMLSQDIFYSTKGTKNEKGSGLGMKITKDFIEKCGGQLSVSSKTGIGSMFSFSIPSSEDSPASI